MTGRARPAPWLLALAGCGLVALAWVVMAVTPSDDTTEAPFVVVSQLGERAEGRNIAVTVDRVVAAETLRDQGWEADGDWVVVELDIESVRSESGVLFGWASLQLGDRRYQASERPPNTIFGLPLSTGLARAGAIAFELPEGTLDEARADGPTEVVLSFAADREIRLDSLIELTVDLGALESEATVELAPEAWGDS